MIKSYESAVEKLKDKRLEQKREQKAKDEIVEQYLQQIKKDHEIEVENLNDYIRELQESGGGRTGLTTRAS